MYDSKAWHIIYVIYVSIIYEFDFTSFNFIDITFTVYDDQCQNDKIHTCTWKGLHYKHILGKHGHYLSYRTLSSGTLWSKQAYQLGPWTWQRMPILVKNIMTMLSCSDHWQTVPDYLYPHIVTLFNLFCNHHSCFFLVCMESQFSLF